MSWAQFFAWLLLWEGRKVHTTKGDAGLQTAWGISRRYHPDWRGWVLVDAGNFGPALEAAVTEFYWDTYGPFWTALPARVRAAFVDTAVNMGVDYAISLTQDALNHLVGNRWVEVDGKWGPQTMAAMKTVDPAAVAGWMLALRAVEYARRGKEGDSRRQWLDGWMNRLRSLMDEV